MLDDIDAIRAELVRLRAIDGGAGVGIDVFTWDGEFRATFTREPGDTERAILFHSGLVIAALRALPDDAGPEAAWDAL